MKEEQARSLADRAIGRLPGPLNRLLTHLREEDLLFLSAGLAFYALVSVAPLVIIAFWLTSLVVGDDTVHRTGEDLARLAPAKLGVDRAFERVADTGTGLGVLAVLAALWPATAYGAGLTRAFDRLAGESRELEGLRGRGLASVLVLVLPAVVLAGLAVATVGPRLLGKGALATAAGWALGLALGFLVVASLAALIYRLFTPEAISWGRIVRGAATAAGGVSLVSLGYAVFLQVGADFEKRYATSGLAAVVLLAVWLFLANALLLVGYRVMRQGEG